MPSKTIKLPRFHPSFAWQSPYSRAIFPFLLLLSHCAPRPVFLPAGPGFPHLATNPPSLTYSTEFLSRKTCALVWLKHAQRPRYKARRIRLFFSFFFSLPLVSGLPKTHHLWCFWRSQPFGGKYDSKSEKSTLYRRKQRNKHPVIPPRAVPTEIYGNPSITLPELYIATRL